MDPCVAWAHREMSVLRHLHHIWQAEQDLAWAAPSSSSSPAFWCVMPP